jgi:hypothetical protein
MYAAHQFDVTHWIRPRALNVMAVKVKSERLVQGVIRYVKDIGLNMLRWESKIASDHIVELADEQGVPVMLGRHDGFEHYAACIGRGEHQAIPSRLRGSRTIRLRNPTSELAFFERAEITLTPNGDEILPIEYDDNYVTVFPGEVAEIHGKVQQSAGTAAWIKLVGYNTPEEAAPIQLAK